MAELIGTTTIGGNEDSLRMMQTFSHSVKDIATYIEKAGEYFGKSEEHLKGMTQTQNQLMASLSTYVVVSENIKNSLGSINDTNKKILDTNKEITKELGNQGDATDKISAKNKEVAEKAEKDFVDVGQKINSAIKDPLSGVASLLKGMASEKDPPSGVASLLKGMASQALVAMGIAKSAYDEFHKMEGIAAAGGIGAIQAFGGEKGFGPGALAAGVSGMGAFKTESLYNRLGGFASAEESTSAAKTLIGVGGMQGKELKEAFSGLAEQAFNTGMKVGELGSIVAKLHRVYEASPDLIRDVMENSRRVAAEAGFDVKEFGMATAEVAARTAKYGVELEDIPIALRQQQEAVYKGHFTQQEYNDILVKGVAAGKSWLQINEEFITTLKEANTEHKKGSEIEKVKDQVSTMYLKYADSTAESGKIAGLAIAGLTKDTMEGRASMQTLTAVFDDMISKFGKTPAEAVTLAKELDVLGKKIDYSGEALGKTIMSVADVYKKLGYSGEESLSSAKGMITHFALNIKNLDISSAELVQITERSKTIFGMTNSETEAMTQTYINMHKNMKISTAALLQWGNQMEDSVITMFDDPKEAAYMAATATKSFGKLLESHQITASDVMTVVKTQMDVFRLTGPDALAKFSALADAVGTTSVRMEEFQKFVADSSKIIKQYGIDGGMANEMFLSFNKYLRDGSMSMAAFNDLLKGPAGAAEGVKALAYEQLSGMGGATGSAFRRMNPLGAIEAMSDLALAAANPADATGALKEAFGENADWQAINEQVQIAISGTIGALISPFGDIKTMDAQAMTKMLSSVLGYDLSKTWGMAREEGIGAITTGKFTQVGRESDEKQTYAQLVKSYANFDSSVNKFDQSVRTLADWRRGRHEPEIERASTWMRDRSKRRNQAHN